MFVKTLTAKPVNNVNIELFNESSGIIRWLDGITNTVYCIFIKTSNILIDNYLTILYIVNRK